MPENPRDILKKMQKKQKETVIKTPKYKNTTVPNIKNIGEIAKEENNYQKFFTKILEYDSIEKIISEMDKFAKDPKGYYARKKLFESINILLPKTLYFYHDFAREYLEHDDKKLQDVWNTYKDLKRLEDLQIKAEENDKERRKTMRRLSGDPDWDLDSDDEMEIKEIVSPPKPKVRGETIQVNVLPLGPKGEVITYDVITNTRQKEYSQNKVYLDEKCISNFRMAPWLNSKVQDIYITNADGNNTDLSMYINHLKKPIQKLGKLWYPVSKDFYFLVCGPKSMEFNVRTQKGDVMTSINKFNQSVSLKVGFSTIKGFILQDEKVYGNEKKYQKDVNKTTIDKSNELLNSPIQEKLIVLAKKQLSNELRMIAPNIRNYGKDGDYDTEYIDEVIQSIVEKSETTQQFLTLLGSLIVYMRESKAKVFKERIRENYYLPSVLILLSIDEKYPEASGNPDNVINIQKQINKYVRDTVKYYFYILNPTLKIVGQTDMEVVNIKVEDVKNRCVNKDIIKDIPAHKLIYYRDSTDKIYCLIIEDVLDQIHSGKEVVNPMTNEKLDDIFLQRFKLLYYNGHENPFDQVANEQTNNKQPGLKQADKEVELAPGLLDVIQKKINECEGEIKDDELDEDGRCPALSEKTAEYKFTSPKAQSIIPDYDSDSDNEPKYTFSKGKILKTRDIKPQQSDRETDDDEDDDDDDDDDDDEDDTLSKPKSVGNDTDSVWVKAFNVDTVKCDVCLVNNLKSAKKCVACGSDLLISSSSFTSNSMCHHCTNPIEHEYAKIKSIQHDGTNYNEAHFCNTKCFETNDFKMNKRSSKKGGRKKTSDK